MLNLSLVALRRVLWLDAVSGLGMAIAHFGFPAVLAQWLGLPERWLLASGAVVVVAVLLSAGLAWRAAPPQLGVRVLAVGNLLWVLASAWVVWGAGLSLTPLGVAWVLAQAVWVLVLAELEWMGSQSLGRRPAGHAPGVPLSAGR